MTGAATVVVEFGELRLQVGSDAGTQVANTASAPAADATALGQALQDGEDGREAGATGTPPAGALESAEQVTARVERAVELWEMLASGTLRVDDLRPEIDSLLDLVARLDGSGRAQEALRLARVVERLLLLLKRWRDLARTLTRVAALARDVGDREALGWAHHELGTLRLVAGDTRGAQRELTAARELRREIGDLSGQAVTEANLGVLCRQRVARGELRERRRPSWRRWAALVAAALILLLIGGVAGAVITRDDDDPRTGTAEPTTTPTPAPTQLAEHTLEVQRPDGGRISSRPDGIDCPAAECGQAFAAGSTVTLTAGADEGHRFDGWSGDCAAFERDVACQLQMDGDRRAGASFVEQVTLTIESEDAVVGLSDNRSCQPPRCEFDVDRGAQVTLTATPPPAEGADGQWRWSEPCADITAPTCTVEMDDDRTVTVSYQAPSEPGPPPEPEPPSVPG